MSKDKPTPHIHAEVIKQWADGEKIQWSDDGNNWREAPVPSWAEQNYYRVKPKPPKVIELYANAEFYFGTELSHPIDVDCVIGYLSTTFISTDNLKLTFCPITGKLIAAEVVKYEKADLNE